MSQPNDHHLEAVSGIAAIGALVRQQRQSQGLKQADAAGLLGVGVRFLSELERGKESLEIGKVLHVLEGLGLKLYITQPSTSGESNEGSKSYES